MERTRIRWADHTWNPMTGCTHVSPGCDHCYAETVALKFGGTAFPNGFDPTVKPHKLPEPARLLRKSGPGRLFVNSMSDVHHESFTWDEVAAVYDAALATPEHDYLVLTKRPQRMAAFMLGVDCARLLHDDVVDPHTPTRAIGAFRDEDDPPRGWLGLRGLSRAPANLWLGTSIENDRYTFRADWLRTIPARVRFLSVEPMLGPVPSLDLHGIGWVIVGGESGPGYRPMDHDWARDVRDRCDTAGIAFFFKQSAAPRTEMGLDLDGARHEEYPYPHPADVGTDSARVVGRFTAAAAGARETR